MKTKKYIASKKYVIYAKKDLLLMTTMKNIKGLEIIVMALENIEELAMIFAI